MILVSVKIRNQHVGIITPALVDNILATLNITRVAPVVYDTAS